MRSKHATSQDLKEVILPTLPYSSSRVILYLSQIPFLTQYRQLRIPILPRLPRHLGTCPQIGLDPQNCCGSSLPATCLNNWVHNGGGATSNPCASVVSIIIECSSAHPALFPSGSIYTSGPQATALAGCMCHDQDGTYDPDVLDGFASECVESGSAAHPTYYPYASRLNGFCTKNAGPATAAASTTTVPVSTKSRQQVPVTSSSAAVIISSAVLSSSASAASSPPASTVSGCLSPECDLLAICAQILLTASYRI